MKSGTSPKLAADHIEKASFFEAPICFERPTEKIRDRSRIVPKFLRIDLFHDAIPLSGLSLLAMTAVSG